MSDKLKIVLRHFFTSGIWLFILLILLDQLTKLGAHFGNWNVTVIPNFFYITLLYNTGAAWGILSGNMPLLAVVSGVAGTTIILFRILYRHKLTTFKKLLIAVILAGTWGNFIDRAFYKVVLGQEGVVDFLRFKFGNYDFPVFNVADICVTLGIICYAVIIAIEDIKEEREKKVQQERVTKEENKDE